MLSLAFGIGANTAIFSLVNAVDSPVERPEEVVSYVHGSGSGRWAPHRPIYGHHRPRATTGRHRGPPRHPGFLVTSPLTSRSLTFDPRTDNVSIVSMPQPPTTGSVSAPPPEELSDDGTGSGVEREDVSADAIQEPFDPDQVAVTTRTITVDLLLSRLQTGALNLQPDFQRKAGIWNLVKQSLLIESLLLRIPLPSFYVSQTENEDWEVVDGVQRLTAISRFVSSTEAQAAGGSLALTGLQYLGGEFDGKRFSDLPPRLARRIRETEFTFHVILSSTPDVVRFNIFARLNTGGMPLTHQELRHALVPGRARYVLRQWASSDSFRRATDYSIKSDRMADREMVLRYIAFFRMASPEEYSRRDEFGAFLMEAMQCINGMSPGSVEDARTTFVSAMDVAYRVFGNDAFRKRYTMTHYRNPINRALFEAVAVNLARLTAQQRECLVDRSQTVTQRLMALMRESVFETAVSVGTSDPKKIRYRFLRVREVFEEIVSDSENPA